MFDLDFSKPMKDLIAGFDLLDDTVNKNVVKAVKKGADKVQKRQKELISGKSSKFAAAIKQTRPYVDKDKNVVVGVGYTKESVAEVGIGGVVLEYGRPGKRERKQGGPGMTERTSPKGNKHSMKIGKVDAVPHIRKGYEETIEEAVSIVVDDLMDGIK